MARLNPYLNFPDGKARPALEFYHAVFGGTLTVTTFGEFGAPDPDLADKIMHGLLVTGDGFVLMGSDLPPGMDHVPGTSITVCLNGTESAQLHGYWDKLAEGATVTTALEKQMWGDEYGSLTDRFGVPWMVNIGAAG